MNANLLQVSVNALIELLGEYLVRLRLFKIN